MTKPSGFIRVYRDFWISDVCRALSANARVVIIDILYRYTSRNNGRIRYSGHDAAGCLNKTKATGYRALAELQEAGLIKPTTKGSFSIKAGELKAVATQWRLTFV